MCQYIGDIPPYRQVFTVNPTNVNETIKTGADSDIR